MESNRDFNFHNAVKSSSITNGLRYSLATGNWGDHKKFNQTKAGVSQVLNRYTYASTLSYLRRVNTPIGRDAKLAKPRQLHNTHFGVVCPAETPEGQSCGLVKNLSLMAHISVGCSSAPVRDLLPELGLQPRDSGLSTKVFVNGNWMGTHADPRSLTRELVLRRRRCSLPGELSVAYDTYQDEVRLLTDAGRISRPLFVVDKGTLNTEALDRVCRGESSWTDLATAGVVEHVDTDEAECCFIAMRSDMLGEEEGHTHCEIHPSMMLGVCASLIPFPDHNQSPRNTYQSAMGKQAMGIYLTNYQNRMDSISNILFYPQKPLVTTRSMDYMHFRDLPAGQNAIVAIGVYSGYNQEDSLIMNQSAIDRGLFRSMFYKTYTEQEKKVGIVTTETFEKPLKNVTANLKPGNYGKLDSDGLVLPGTILEGDDVIVGKTVPLSALGETTGLLREKGYARRDASVALKTLDKGVVDKVMLSTNQDGFRFAKVRLRSVRIPQMGDKFASRHGQKGTVGITYRHEDMPFTADGMVPDIIVNPHAIPSRMTIGHLIECLQGKVAALTGLEGDATPFGDVTVENITDVMAMLGYEKSGFETLYNGFTGQKLAAQIFIGPTYYQRLKHMVDDKIHRYAKKYFFYTTILSTLPFPVVHEVQYRFSLDSRLRVAPVTGACASEKWKGTA